MDKIQIEAGYFQHFKIQKLRRKLGTDAVLCHLILLTFTASNKPKGNLTGMDEEDIEIASNWTGESGKFVEALVDLRLLDKTKSFFRVHDWQEHNAYLYNKPERIRQARKAARARWKNRTKSKITDGADSINGHSAQHPEGNAFLGTETVSKTVSETVSKTISKTGVFKLFELYTGRKGSPTPALEKILIQALRTKSLEDWKKWIESARNALSTHGQTLPAPKFYFQSDYAKWPPQQPARKKVHFVCPKGCSRDPGMWAPSYITNFCIVCEERRIPEKK